MRYSAAGTLDAVAHRVPHALVGPRAWARARSTARWLPAPLAGAFYLECRLAPRAPRVDWIVRVDAPGRDIIAGRNPVLALPHPVRDDAVWRRLARLCAAWADEAPLRRAVSHLWLEFDLEGAGEPPRPSLFVGFHAGAVAGLEAPGWGALLDLLLDRLGPGATRAGTRAAVLRVLERRPPGARIPYLGFMLARPRRPVRVYLAGVPAERLPDLLPRVGWPGAPGALAALQLPHAPPVSTTYVDVDGEVQPSAGVEYRFGGADAGPFLQRLVDAGLCAPPKMRGLEAWPGGSVEVLRHELWASRVGRRVNHVKLVHAPGQPPQAKGYLLTSWHPVRRGPCELPHPAHTGLPGPASLHPPTPGSST